MVTFLKTARHNFTIALILLTFVSQLIAAPLETCEEGQIFQQQTSDTVDNNSKTTHDMSTMDSHEFMSEDCCGDDCNCLMSSCVSVMMHSTALIAKIHKYKSIDLSPLKSFFVNHHNPLILRPPIFS